MGAVGKGHKREKRPVILQGRVAAIFDAEPAFYFRPPATTSAFLYRSMGLTTHLA